MRKPRLTPEERKARKTASDKRYAQKNAERIRAYQAKWRSENVPGRKEYAANYHLENADLLRQRARDWYADNPEQAKLSRKLWREANPEKRRASHRKRKALIRGASRSDFTDAEFEILCEIFEYRCAYCHAYTPVGLTRDHIEPLIKGGPDTLWNIVPACPHCNFSKHAGPVPAPVQPLLLAVPASPNPNKKPTKQRKATNGTRKASL
jgi:5-methylcytosine-specific restriction endonuclease McrA